MFNSKFVSPFRNYKWSFLTIPSLLGDPDKIHNTTPTEQAVDKSVLKEETGWDRLKIKFTADEVGNISPEANSVLQTAFASCFVGGLYGGFISSRKAYMDFMRNNDATSFQSHFEAKRTLQDRVTISFGKGAFKWAWRASLFSTSFMGLITVIQVYRAKYGVMEYALAGGLTGALYKFNMGPRAWIVGGGLGTALGACCGGIVCAILNLTGLTMEETRYWQNQFTSARNEAIRKKMADHVNQEEYAIINVHNKELGDAGKDITNLEKK